MNILITDREQGNEKLVSKGKFISEHIERITTHLGVSISDIWETLNSMQPIKTMGAYYEFVDIRYKVKPDRK